jgi:hypothetical protein
MNTAEEPKLVEELSKMGHEPLIPAEKKLMAYSIILGLILLGILYWISATFFTVQH